MITVQDDTGLVANANAYISYAEFQAYHGLRSNDYSAFTQAQVEAAIVRATDYMDVRYVPGGVKLTGVLQVTQFPRDQLYAEDGTTLITGIPARWKNACAELALKACSGPLVKDSLQPDAGRTVVKTTEKIGPITEETEYAQSGAATLPVYQLVDMMVGPLLRSRGGRGSASVYR